MDEIAVYLGPTLPRAEAQSILRARFLPPIRRGDLAKLAPEVRLVGIIDGEFYQNLAVSPKEILPLLQRGVRVFGSSSMGALRAAELHTHGMLGVGRIFALYRDGLIEADDEVAVAYDPETYRPLSVPLVNIRFALEAAVHEGSVERQRACALMQHLAGVYFPDRTWAGALALCPELGRFLEHYAPDRKAPDQKAEDAQQLLRVMAGAAAISTDADTRDAEDRMR
jgi:TfuA protein